MKYTFDTTLDHRYNGSVRWAQPEGRQDILGMGTADLDYFCAPCIREATAKVCEENTFNYRSRPREYTEAIVGWFHRKYALSVEDAWLRDLPSTIAAIRLTIGAYCKPGDYIIMQSPYFTPLVEAIEGAGCHLLENRMLLKEEGYEIDFEDFERKIKQFKPAMFILVSPQNPTGRVFSKEELEKMVDICEENHVIILSDEVHALITYDGRRHYPILAISEKARSISIMVFSFSKGFNMMSLPHAMILIPNIELRKRWDAYLRPFDFHYASNSFSIAAVTAIASGQADEWLEQATAYLQQNRDLFLALVREKQFPIRPLVPEASYLFWIDCKKMEADPEALDQVFMEQAGISLNNGLYHGEAGRGFVRLNFGVTKNTLREAVVRMEKMFGQMK